MSSEVGQLAVFEPSDPRECLRGWALHTTRRRQIHEAQARSLDRWNRLLGVLAAGLAAFVGTSAFAAWQTDEQSSWLAVVSAALGAAAAILAGALTFLDLGASAEAHRRAAAAYKNVLRELEQDAALRGAAEQVDEATLSHFKALLAEADAGAPVVPVGLGKKAEKRRFRFIAKADDLGPNAPR